LTFVFEPIVPAPPSVTLPAPSPESRQATRRLLSTHSLLIAVLPLKDGRVLRIREASFPDPEQALIYQNSCIHRKTAFPFIKSLAYP
jgi:hypothetical protein